MKDTNDSGSLPVALAILLTSKEVMQTPKLVQHFPHRKHEEFIILLMSDNNKIIASYVNCMKSLVVFYTRTGTTKKAAEAIAKELGCETEEISDNKQRSGPIGYLMAGKDAAMKTIEKLKDLAHDPADYDLVIIGTPVWNFSVSSPVRTFLITHKDRLKKVAFFFTGGGGGGNVNKNVLPHMTVACGKDPVATLALRTDEVARNEHMEKIREFAKKIKG